MKRWIYCPYCNSEKTDIKGYDDEDALYECFDCGHTFTLDEIDKVFTDDEDNENANT